MSGGRRRGEDMAEDIVVKFRALCELISTLHIGSSDAVFSCSLIEVLQDFVVICTPIHGCFEPIQCSLSLRRQSRAYACIFERHLSPTSHRPSRADHEVTYISPVSVLFTAFALLLEAMEDHRDVHSA
jgi:hypothetical protein